MRVGGRIVARLFPLLVLIALVVVALVARQHLRPRSDRVYRPRASPFGRRPPDAGGDANWVASRWTFRPGERAPPLKHLPLNPIVP